MADYQYGLSNIQDNHILHQVISKRKQMCESIIDEPSSECYLDFKIFILLILKII